MNRLKPRPWVAGLALGAMLTGQTAPLSYAAGANDNNTTTPIKHVMLIIGENRTFDHLFGTYRPRGGQTISNLLSKKIVDMDGQPAQNAYLAQQYEADDAYPKLYSNSPARTGLFPTLPQPNVGNPTNNGTAPFATVADAMAIEPGLLFPDYYLLTLGTTGIPTGWTLDFRMTFRTILSGSRTTSPTSHMRVVRFIASSRCGRNSIAASLIPRPATRVDALRTSSPGSR